MKTHKKIHTHRHTHGGEFIALEEKRDFASGTIFSLSSKRITFILFDFALGRECEETECALDEHTILMTTIITVITAKLSSHANAGLIVNFALRAWRNKKKSNAEN
jgi:hypothetical protein